MDRYLEAEKRLAGLLGWKPVAGTQGWHDPKGDYRLMLPQWCRDWGDCGPLMVLHGCYPEFDESRNVAIAYYLNGNKCLLIDAFDYPDRDTAVRFAIVQAVIAKLSTQQEG
jgi:hypothetical protein